MDKENKDLLLRDLCARLPHGVKLGFYASATKQTYICTLLGLEPQEDEPVIAKTENGSFYMLAGNVKPYLFPLSSMTEEQKEFIKNQFCYDWDSDDPYSLWTYCIEIGAIDALIDLFNKYHIDYRGLIPRGLAIDATGLNIY